MTKHQTETVHEHIDRVSDEAALKIMSEILRVVRDRGNVGDAAFERLTCSDVENFYNSLIAPGIDIIEARMLPSFRMRSRTLTRTRPQSNHK